MQIRSYQDLAATPPLNDELLRRFYFSKTNKSYPQLAVFTPIFSKFAALRKKSR
jgi:hypothetical protein